MLYLPKPSTADLARFAESVKKVIENNVASSTIPDKAKAYLDENRIVKILIDTSDKLIRYHREFMPLLIEGFCEKEYKKYFKIRLKQKKKRSLVETTLINKYDEERKKLLDIFDYDKIISKSKAKSYSLASTLNRFTCTYCNRLYTNTIITKTDKGSKINNGHRISRPQFDHWFAHSIYPILGMSFYNLIPSCSVCNSSVKGDEVFDLSTHIHPYMYDNTEVFKFSFEHKSLKDLKVKIIVKKGSRMENHLMSFKIKEVYDAHSSMELKDLLELRYKYSENYIHELFYNTFKSLEISEKEVYRMVFGLELEEENFHKRPFSKFKYDIIKELLTIE